MELGVQLNRVIDLGSGPGMWLNAFQRSGLATGPNYAIDISEQMLEKISGNAMNTTPILGGVESLDNVTGEADCLFMSMISHLLEFPADLVRITGFAQKKNIPSVVVVEEVSPLYHVLAGNSQFTNMLPDALAYGLNRYKRYRSEAGLDDLGLIRDAPLPLPSLPDALWLSMGLKFRRYHFETPSDIAWTLDYRLSDLVSEIRERRRSCFFQHSQEEAAEIADLLGKELAQKYGADLQSNLRIPFWFNMHIFYQ